MLPLVTLLECIAETALVPHIFASLIDILLVDSSFDPRSRARIDVARAYDDQCCSADPIVRFVLQAGHAVAVIRILG
jgi:hypothetical protein